MNTPTQADLGIPVHPAAGIFPLLEGSDYEALKADIAERGQTVPCVLWRDGSLLDGRNRWRACRELGVEPKTETWDGDDPFSYVVSTNLKRRHLTPSQAAMVATEALPLLEAEAAARQQAAGARGGEGGRGHRKPSAQACAKGSRRERSDERAAALFGTSGRYVSDAKAIKARSPALAEEVRRGTMTIPEAIRLARPGATAKGTPAVCALLERAAVLLRRGTDEDDAAARALVDEALEIARNGFPGGTVQDLVAAMRAAEKVEGLARAAAIDAAQDVDGCVKALEDLGIRRPPGVALEDWAEALLVVAGERLAQVAS